VKGPVGWRGVRGGAIGQIGMRDMRRGRGSPASW
jgi:hypothetical protein